MHVVGNSHELASEDVLPTGDGVLIIDEVKVQYEYQYIAILVFWCCLI